jgi:hypothetical protein
MSKQTLHGLRGEPVSCALFQKRISLLGDLSEAPDDAAAAKASLLLATRGNVRTETLRAFTEEGFRKIVIGL